jgi:choline oxidase
VVGAGAAGAVLARRLADAGCTVALLEAGSSDQGCPEIADLGRYQEVLHSRFTQRLPVLARAGGNPRPVYPVARVLGGGTSLNTCVWFRPPTADFVDWVDAGASGWGPEMVRPAFAELEQRIGIETVDHAGEPHRCLLRAAGELGYPAVDFADDHAAGVGRYRLSKQDTLRRSASVVFLHPPSRPPDTLHVFTNVVVTRLLLEGRAVRGVATDAGTFLARREVVLSAGAFGTPKLLMLSGIGPAEELRALGIEVCHNLAGVGRHLLDHPACAVNMRAARPVPRQATWNYAGVLFADVSDLPEGWPDIEMQLGPELFEQQTAAAGYPGAPHGFCAYLTVNRARSEGSVRLVSPDPAADIVIDPNFFGDAEGYDLGVMTGGVRLARRLFSASALQCWMDEELAPGAGCQTDATIGDYLRQTVTTGYHPAGTCRMGEPGAPGTVVGPDLRVAGIRGLRVADASVFPSMVSVNIASTCMMVGLRCADLILRERVPAFA